MTVIDFDSVLDTTEFLPERPRVLLFIIYYLLFVFGSCVGSEVARTVRTNQSISLAAGKRETSVGLGRHHDFRYRPDIKCVMYRTARQIIFS